MDRSDARMLREDLRKNKTRLLEFTGEICLGTSPDGGGWRGARIVFPAPLAAFPGLLAEVVPIDSVSTQ
jgi:hypothetical protein